MKDPEVIKELADGRLLRDYDPVGEYADGEENYHVKPKMKGIAAESALRKLVRRDKNILAMIEYAECIPCINCFNCVVVRELEHGEVKNKIYACHRNRVQVSRYGTCKYAMKGNGPMVIERDLTMEEIMANKDKLIN